MNEKQINALFERANNFIRMGNLNAAIADYTEVLRHKPDFAPAYFNRGFARQHGQGDVSGAIADFSDAIRLNPAFAEAFVNRAIAHAEQKDYADALADYDAALQHNPKLSHAYSNRGEIHFLTGDLRAAADDFRKAEQLKPGYRYALAGLAISLHAAGSIDEAQEIWRGLISRNTNFKDAAWVKEELGWRDDLVEEAARLIDELK
jgi:tetratricopeptide (TPR) repeat protein